MLRNRQTQLKTLPALLFYLKLTRMTDVRPSNYQINPTILAIALREAGIGSREQLPRAVVRYILLMYLIHLRNAIYAL